MFHSIYHYFILTDTYIVTNISHFVLLYIHTLILSNRLKVFSKNCWYSSVISTKKLPLYAYYSKQIHINCKLTIITHSKRRTEYNCSERLRPVLTTGCNYCTRIVMVHTFTIFKSNSFHKIYNKIIFDTYKTTYTNNNTYYTACMEHVLSNNQSNVDCWLLKLAVNHMQLATLQYHK